MWKSFLLLTTLVVVVVAAPDKIVCYYGSWAHYRQGDGQFSVDRIDPFLCTHVIYGFIGINGIGSPRIMDSWLDIDLGGYRKLNALKDQNPCLKTLIAIGGWNEGSTNFSAVAASPTLRTAFVYNIIVFLKTHEFDGLDFDWEYPGQRGGSEQDKENFVLLLKELREAFDKCGLILSAAVAATASSVDLSYNVPKLNEYLHFINVMTYDLHGAWDTKIGHNSPLYPSSSCDITDSQKQLNVHASINTWIERGASPENLVLGVGAYGRSFTVANACDKFCQSHTGGGTAGPYTGEAGILGYNEICEKLNAGGWTVIRDGEQQVPHMCRENQWVGYDDPESIAIKCNYAKARGLGGIMIWSVETDDFKGKCGQVNPLLNTIKATLNMENCEDTMQTSSETTEDTCDITPPSPDPGSPTTTPTDKIVCYHGSWAHYRPGDGQFSVDKIDPFLCTHIIYGFVGINWDGSIRIMDSWLDIDLAALQKFNALKKQNPSLKTLVAIGGWNEGSTTFSAVATSATLRTAFVNNAVKFLQTHGFDGFDLDWEYPAQRGGAATDKDNFSKMIAEFREVFDKYGFLITAAVAACSASVDLSYNVPDLDKYLHFINVMTYDLHGAWDTAIGHNSPLYASSSCDLTAAQKELNVDACINTWITRGATPKNLILGVGAYGRSFTVANACDKFCQSHSGGGTAGPYTREAGILGYSEIVEKLNAGGWTVIWDNEQQVPHMCSGNQWVGYDNPKSIGIKCNYAKARGLGGIMVWSVETDDFKGKSGQVNPLLSTIKDCLACDVCTTPTVGPEKESTTTETVTGTGSGTGTETTTTTEGTDRTICVKDGYLRDPTNCSVFYQCVCWESSCTKYSFLCPSGLYFDLTVNGCNYPANVAC